MTAEAVVMNKNAIAIATDSAVTVTMPTGSGPKIWNTVNKLFNISYTAPVAGMVYGNAEFSGFPWETLMKMYRRHLGDRIFDTIPEYADDFMVFLHTIAAQHGVGAMDFTQIVNGYFYDVQMFVMARIKQANVERDSSIELDELVETAISDYEEGLKQNDDVECVADLTQTQILACYRREIYAARKFIIDRLFGNMLTRKAKKALWRIAYLCCIKDVHSINTSGLVIGGFGEKNVFPSLREYSIDGVICGKIKYKIRREAAVDHQMQAVIIPFAQHDMVFQFMEGVDKDYNILCERLFKDLMDALVDFFVTKYVRRKARRDELLKELRALTRVMGQRMEKKLGDYRRDNFTDPVIEAVKGLPKEEMAMLAESLVQLTSLKRRVSTELETVGEPIDVAVISKGDGFVWIKRKHYFQPELNPRFVHNYASR
jgi:hypothetical protein